MSDNVTVNNVQPATAPVGYTKETYKVATRQLTDNSQVQQVQIDLGTGANSSPVTESNPLPVSGTVTTNTKSTGSNFPIYKDSLALNADADLRVDVSGNLVTRGSVLTDEGSIYEPFAGNTLSANWTQFVGTGGSISVANSVCSIASGTTANAATGFYRVVDYSPIAVSFSLALSQRIANQELYIGIFHATTWGQNATQLAQFKFTGTDNTKVRCASQSSTDTGGNEGGASGDIILPRGYLTSQELIYRIDFDGEKVHFLVGATGDDLIRIASRSVQIPNMYSELAIGVTLLNGSSSPALSGTVSVDTIYCKNYNIIDVQGEITGDVRAEQNIKVSTVNSSTTNLDAGNSYTFTGKSESALNDAGIQVTLFADKNCTVKVQQSQDGTNWDISDSYNYYANSSFGITVQSVASYFRTVVTTASLTTTTFRLQSIICPIIEPLPRSLDSNGYLKTAIESIEDGYGFEVENTPMGEMRTVQPTRLVGASFDGTTIDSNFWTATVANSATVTQANAQIVLTSGTNSAGDARLTSLRRARYVSANANGYRAAVQLGDVGTADNTRSWGVAHIANYNFTVSAGTAVVGNVYSNNSQQFTCLQVVSPTSINCFGTGAPSASGTLTFVSGPGSGNLTYTAFAAVTVPTDGALFRLTGTTFSVVTLKGGSPTTVNTGSFNGLLGATYTPGTSTITYEIYWTNSKVYFVIGGEVLHTVSASAATWANTMSFYIYNDNVNSGNTTSVTLSCRVASIRRLGQMLTQPTSRYQSGTTAGIVLKYGAGNLHSVVISGIANTSNVTLYDNTAASGNIIWSSGAMAVGAQSNNLPYAIDFKGLPFFNGLTLVIATAASNTTIVYE